MGKNIGKRLGGEPNQPKEKRKRLTGLQTFLLVILILLVLAVAAVFVWKKTFVRPELPDKSQTTVTTDPETGEVEEEVIDYGDGIRPKAEGKRKSEDYYTSLVLGRDRKLLQPTAPAPGHRRRRQHGHHAAGQLRRHQPEGHRHVHPPGHHGERQLGRQKDQLRL